MHQELCDIAILSDIVGPMEVERDTTSGLLKHCPRNGDHELVAIHSHRHRYRQRKIVPRNLDMGVCVS